MSPGLVSSSTGQGVGSVSYLSSSMTDSTLRLPPLVGLEILAVSGGRTLLHPLPALFGALHPQLHRVSIDSGRWASSRCDIAPPERTSSLQNANHGRLTYCLSSHHAAAAPVAKSSCQANGHDALEEKLGRLSKKPGVKASIVLDRVNGVILKTSGDVSALRTAKARDAATAVSFSNEAPVAEESESKGLEDFAAMIWNFVNTSGQLVQEVDTEVRLALFSVVSTAANVEQDELRLLRLRTKKQEIVIVPDSKYILAVVHDTPPA